MGARRVFVTGATGYMGRPLVERLLARGHAVRGLVRAGSVGRLPQGCEPVIGDALDGATYAAAVERGDVFVHLVGVAHPSPAKAKEFESIDLMSVQVAVECARRAGVARFVYVSVAQPAPVMKAYIAVRAAGETLLRESGLPATILRPWYVLGPGHWWPLALVPLYGIMTLFPGGRETARRLGLVTRKRMLTALVQAAESDAPGITIAGVDDIRAARLDDMPLSTPA